ncbi:arrestin (macronuclear) [Tetrahymena thermophila SB210]|uniref:Arrestin n=1 Tax=Tetrahymena thermophila (strain SB210) TaxID=312017 RepID=Q22CF7_TETTS|nr:arrestin [Tetrahymena thermophila SB210]EAR82972.1 arrestin [Tetrahymena thermophila SB210]|eukprot:XP_001030635.1 arrestin [Tetrahymena thermophila SB210]
MNNQQNNQSLSNSYGSMIIVLNKPHFYPGEPIQGRILLRLYMDFPLKEMSLQFLGVEKIKDLKAVNQIAFPKKELFNHISKISQSYSDDQNILKAGKHIFPFKINLHFNTPGTYSVFDGRIKGKITHKIICKIENSFNPQLSIVSKEKVNVRELLSVQPQQHFTAEIFKTIYSCFGCVNQRECRIMCSFDRQFYTNGEQGTLSILVHNQSDLDITSFSATLWQVYSKKTQIPENQKLPKAQFDQQNQLILFKQCIREQIYEGVKANSKETQLSNSFQFVNYNSNLPLPPSVKGTFTSNYYYVEIKAHFEGCSVQSLILQVPVNLVLSSQQPSRTFLDIQNQVMTKLKQREQEKEVIMQEFNEMSHYHIIHNEIEVSAAQNIYDIRDSIKGTVIQNQQNQLGQYGNMSVYDVNNSQQRLVESPQKYVIPSRGNDDYLRYTVYKQQQDNQGAQQILFNQQPRQSGQILLNNGQNNNIDFGSRNSYQNTYGNQYGQNLNSNSDIRLNLQNQQTQQDYQQQNYNQQQLKFGQNNYYLNDQTPKFN